MPVDESMLSPGQDSTSEDLIASRRAAKAIGGRSGQRTGEERKAERYPFTDLNDSGIKRPTGPSIASLSTHRTDWLASLTIKRYR